MKKNKVKNKTAWQQGFTLVEMLVVVLIIAILIGIAVRIVSWSKNVKEKAVTLKRMEQLRMAIEEYRAAYGSYPPVDPDQTYPRDSINCMIPDIDSISQVMSSAGGANADDFEKTPVFVFGLMAYLIPRYQNSRWDLAGFDNKLFENPQWHKSNKTVSGAPLRDNGPRDEREWEKWKPFIDDIIEPRAGEDLSAPKPAEWWRYRGDHVVIMRTSSGPRYALRRYTVWDGWRNPDGIKYRSDPPHTTYRLWAETPGGVRIEGDVGF